MRRDPSLAETAQDLSGLRRNLLFLLRDVGDEVVDDVEGADARRATRPRDSLHRGHEHAHETEGIEEGLQRDRESDRRAVGQREDEPLPAPAPLLLPEEWEVSGEVDAGEGDGDVGLVAEGGRRAHHGNGARIAGFELARCIALDCGKDEVDGPRIEVRCVRDRKGEELRRRLGGGPPAAGAVCITDRLPVRPARRSG